MLPSDTIDWNSGEFRGAGLHSSSDNLFNVHLAHLKQSKGLGHGISPNKKWLFVDPSKESNGRIVCARSERYRNGSFPWSRIVKHYGERLLFVGLQHEHAEFCSSFGGVQWKPVTNFLEMAQVIAGSELFIGNQSSPMTIAEGLKHPTIQETSTDPADCIYFRDNAQWVDNGGCTLPDIGGSGVLEIAAKTFQVDGIVTHTTPPGQWQVEVEPGKPPIVLGVFSDLMNVCKLNGIGPKDSLANWIKVQNAIRVPEFFFGDAIYQFTKNSEGARRNAGYPARSSKQMLGL